MSASTLFVAASAAACTAATATVFNPPKFCKDLNCPNFTVIDHCTDGDSTVEIREYAPATWVGSSIEGPTTGLWPKANYGGFMIGFAYISGDNSENEKIKMTCPVKSLILPGKTAECNTTIRTSFFLPYAYQVHDGGVKPPTPNNAAVTLNSAEAYTLAVRSFGGFTNDYEKQVQPQFEALSKQLKQRDVEFDTSRMVVQGYDSPFTTTDRHNEVAFFVTAGTKCSGTK